MDAPAAAAPASGTGRGRGRGRGRPPKNPGDGSTPGKTKKEKAAAAAAAAAAAEDAPGGEGGGGDAAAGSAAPANPALAPAGGVAKKRGRPPRSKAAAEAAAAAAAAAATGAPAESEGEEPVPDTAAAFRGTFTKDLQKLLYGFGDHREPHKETVDLVEDILVDYVRDTVCGAVSEAMRLGKLGERDRATGQAKLKIDEKDILFLVRKDPKKYTRIRDLLEMQQAIKEARKAVDETELMRYGDAAEGAEGEGAGGAGDAAGAAGGGGAEDLGQDDDAELV